ncbi:DEAD/DEAH box helicase [Hymenobacter artigasi]|uniref:DNA 3'-5' helicase n=1 Tax=Hymenobacter artigasi TaxID=2719616 RepID=A0ABX1HI29_9BACT|nr:DEAD/DEAH box helicase [Hymenobacter artigasi]NKI89500.1 hypothetical protein [Hymenobacter artigasi]
MQKAQVLKQFGISHEQFEKALTEHGVEADLKFMRVVPDHLVELLARVLGQPEVGEELTEAKLVDEPSKLIVTSQIAQPNTDSVTPVPAAISEAKAAKAVAVPASHPKESYSRSKQQLSSPKQPEASEWQLGQVVEVVGEPPKVYGFIRGFISGERRHVKVPLFGKYPFALKDGVLFVLSLEKAEDKPTREVVSWIQPIGKNIALLRSVITRVDIEPLYQLLKPDYTPIHQYVAREALSRLEPITNGDTLDQAGQTLHRLWKTASATIPEEVAFFLKRTAPEHGWKLWFLLQSPAATNGVAYTAQESARLADLLAKIPEVIKSWLPHVASVESLLLLLAAAPAENHPTIVWEAINRLPPITDTVTADQVIQTLYSLQKLMPDTVQEEAKALLKRTAPELGWQLWLRFLSPLAIKASETNASVAGRLADLLAGVPDVVTAWLPQAQQVGLVGLCMLYVQQDEEQVASLFKQLQATLGDHELYTEVVTSWLKQLEAIITEQEFLQCQYVANTIPQAVALSEKALFELAVPDVQLKVWNRVSGVIFPQEAAISYFEYLLVEEKDDIAAQLDDEGFARITGLLTVENSQAIRQRARTLLNQQIVTAFAALGLDLESDRQTIHEIAWGRPGAWHIGKGEEAVAAVVQELRERVAGGPAYLLAGHNVRDFDAGILAVHDVALPPDFLWDTLLVEMGLSPDWRVLALKTKHEAEYDADLGLQLFTNQVLRLQLAAPTDWEVLRQLLPPGAQDTLGSLRAQSVTSWLTVEALRQEALTWLRPQPQPSTILQELRAAVAQAQAPVKVVVAAREFWRELYAEPGLTFLTNASTAPDYHPLVGADVLARLAGHPVEEALARQFFSYCQRAQLAPVPATMAPALRFRLQQLADFSECQAVAEPDWQQPQFVCLTAQQLRGQVDLLMEVQAELFVVEPDLITLSNKELLRQQPLSMNELRASPATQVAAMKFSGGQSFMRLSRTQAEELGATVPADIHNLWLEKHRQDEYRIWGSFGWEKLLTHWKQREQVKYFRSADRKLPKQPTQMHSAVVGTYKLQRQLGATTCNPETNFRAHYWLLQANLLTNLSRDEQTAASPAEPAAKAEPIATVLLVQRPEEIPALENYFRGQYQYFIPQRASALGRQLELLHQHSSPRRLLIASMQQAASLLEANYLGPLRVVLESFNLLENFYLAQGSHLFRQAQANASELAVGGEPTEELETQPEAVDEVPDEADETAEEASPDPGRQAQLEQDLFFLLKLQQPVVQQLRAQLADNHAENQLWLLDPRLADFPALEQAWQMSRRTYEASWKNEPDYKEAAKTAQLVLGGPQPAQDFILDLDAAKNLLQQIFLGKGEWYDYQHPYLDKILAAKTDVLVSLPTGGGKSLLFQAPALYRSAYTNRLSIVVTPLKALMQDQVQKLWELGFHSSVEAINQDNVDELPQIYRRLAGGEIRLLFITPERFRSGAFIRAFELRMANDGGLEYAIYDEAHCISQWGHEFRPDYLYSAQVMQRYRKENLATTKRSFPVLLFSATVSEKIYEGFNQLFS